MMCRGFAKRRIGFTIVELVVVLALILVLCALLLVSVGKVRQAAARTASMNNLRQISLAFQSYHDAWGHFPYNGTENALLINGTLHGGPAVAGNFSSGSWGFMILPYVEQEPLFYSLDNQVGVAVFMCPGRGRPISCTGNGGPGAWSDYFINSFLNDPNGDPTARNSKRTLPGIIDGSAETILVGHGQIRTTLYSDPNTVTGFTDIIFNGGSPGNCRSNTTVVNGPDSPQSQPGNWGGPFPEGSLMAMVDGSIRVFSYEITGGTISDGESDAGNGAHVCFARFLTPSGGEQESFNSATPSHGACMRGH